MTAVTTASLPKFPWRVFMVLSAVNIVASVLLVPYSLTLLAGTAIPSVGQYLILVMVQVVSTALVSVPLAWLGLFLGTRIGLGAPFLAAWVNGEPPPRRPGFVLTLSLGLGVLAGGAILLLAAAVSPLVQAEYTQLGLTPPEITPPNAWQGFLASISAAITEETVLRLFLLTMLAWFGSQIRQSAGDRPAPPVLWIANVMASLIFGMLHLPLASSLMPVTSWVVIQVLALNGLAGLVFGWLYWKYGLESAMLAHFALDVVLHVIPPLVWSG